MADVAQLCSQLIRIDTTNYGGGESAGERDAAELVADILASAGIGSKLLERTPRRSNVIARLTGRDSTLPALLVQGHLDVVPADPAQWTRDPFSGDITDGYVWGRGATDMKDFIAMVLTVVNAWAHQDRAPRRDIVLAFVADEEDAGHHGAEWLVDEHPQLFHGCGATISESGGYSYHVTHADGTPRRLYPIGTAERGTSHLRLTATGRAGHGSRHNDDNAVTKLVSALDRIAHHPWPTRLTPTVTAFLERTGHALGTDIDLSDMDTTLTRLGKAAPLIENTIRNSTRPTVLKAGYKVNVIPSTATAEIDTRTLPGTEQELLDTIDALLGDGITREFVNRSPAIQAPVDSPWFDAMTAAIHTQDPDAIVVPYCMGGGTDAKAFARLGIPGYGFAPLSLPQGFDYRAMAHGVDERVPVDGLHFGTRVLDHFLSTV
nr:M20/M25/M40 family metallo-hydrolase [Kibdelosporangium sp. MJ126-NF4]CEL13727.1 FIG016551: Putative peptidase [Kibdelosporangium sp. MJ126-NF4]CTQ99414.1 FIG016551: Putative peptidase [Kibdelosporangium sp. MJ126-NF4]